MKLICFSTLIWISQKISKAEK